MRVTILKIVNILSTNRNIKLIKKVRRQDHYFSTRLPFANKKIGEIFYSTANNTYKPKQDKINKIQSLKGITKVKIYQIISDFYDKMNIRRQF